MIQRALERAGSITEALSAACATHEVMRRDLPLTHNPGCDRVARSAADLGARETTIQLFLHTTCTLSRKSVVVNTCDTPQLIKRQVGDIDLTSFGLPAKRQALRCICSQEVRQGEIKLAVHTLYSTTLASMPSTDCIVCTPFVPQTMPNSVNCTTSTAAGHAHAGPAKRA